MINESETLTVYLDGFEGPLDLLLHLIKELKMDIFDIPMKEITEQYFHYLHTLQELKLDIAAEYLLMAATLLEIKSRMLLPKKELEIEEEFYEEGEDPREELVNQLLEYKQIQEAAKTLKEMEMERGQFFTKPATNLENYQQAIPLMPGEVSTDDLLNALRKMQQKLLRKKPLQARVNQEEISVEQVMNRILDRFSKLDENSNGKIPFEDFFDLPERPQIVNTFLAMLELAKERKIFFTQTVLFGGIFLERYSEGTGTHDQ